MQTILGAGGAIGKELAKVLPQYTDQVRLVARNPKAVLGNEELVSADLLDLEATKAAVQGSDVVYLCVGLTYNIKVWQSSWPRIMANTIEACADAKAKLVFFDNIYMYHPSEMSNITEDSKKDPQSEKGKVRLGILNQLWAAHKEGRIQATVARSADFYGPNAGSVSVMEEAVLKPLQNGKAANWFASLKNPHSFTYTIDAAKGTAILGNSEIAWGEEWHLPTAKNPLTGKEYIETIAALVRAKPKTQVAGKGILRILGLFNPIMKEFVEMIYQYDRPYYFNSEKFESTFNYTPLSYQEGLKSLI